MANRTELSKKNPPVEVRKGLHGKGVFAKAAIADDEVVGRVAGVVTDDYELDPQYSMELDNDLVLVPQGTFRYLNHSCDPNAELFVWEDDDSDESMNSRPLFVATLRAVDRGEELTIDYGWPADSAIECHCGSTRCRGWIVDPKELPKLLAQKKKEAAPQAKVSRSGGSKRNAAPKKSPKRSASKKSSAKKASSKKATAKRASKKKAPAKKAAKKKAAKKKSSKKRATKKSATKKSTAKKKATKKKSAEKRGGRR